MRVRPCRPMRLLNSLARKGMPVRARQGHWQACWGFLWKAILRAAPVTVSLRLGSKATRA
jgi:hypothetical protein